MCALVIQPNGVTHDVTLVPPFDEGQQPQQILDLAAQPQVGLHLIGFLRNSSPHATNLQSPGSVLRLRARVIPKRYQVNTRVVEMATIVASILSEVPALTKIRVMGMLEKILRAGQARGWKQLEIERRAGLARNRISKIKDDEGKMRWEEVLRLAQTVGVSLDWLASDSPDDLLEPAPADLVVILELVKTLGVERAKSRLMALPDPDPAPAPGYHLRGQAKILDPGSAEGPHRPDEPGAAQSHPARLR